METYSTFDDFISSGSNDQRQERTYSTSSNDQRRGITGKADASRLPSFAYKWEQLDPGKIDDAQEVKQYGIDRQFMTTRSSNIEQILYAKEKLQLFAVFKARDKYPRSAYVYFNVPEQVYNRLYYMERSGKSVGKEFWILIRIKPRAHRYNYKKIRGDERKKGQRVAVKGAYAHYGMPDKYETPYYAKHTVQTMKRAEAYSARKNRSVGTSNRGKKNLGGRR